MVLHKANIKLLLCIVTITLAWALCLPGINYPVRACANTDDSVLAPPLSTKPPCEIHYDKATRTCEIVTNNDVIRAWNKETVRSYQQDIKVSGKAFRNRWAFLDISYLIGQMLTLNQEHKFQNPKDILIFLLKKHIKNRGGEAEILLEGFDIDGIQEVREGQSITGFSLPVTRKGSVTHKLMYNLQSGDMVIRTQGGRSIYVKVETPPAFDPSGPPAISNQAVRKTSLLDILDQYGPAKDKPVIFHKYDDLIVWLRGHVKDSEKIISFLSFGFYEPLPMTKAQFLHRPDIPSGRTGYAVSMVKRNNETVYVILCSEIFRPKDGPQTGVIYHQTNVERALDVLKYNAFFQVPGRFTFVASPETLLMSKEKGLAVVALDIPERTLLRQDISGRELIALDFVEEAMGAQLPISLREKLRKNVLEAEASGESVHSAHFLLAAEKLGLLICVGDGKIGRIDREETIASLPKCSNEPELERVHAVSFQDTLTYIRAQQPAQPIIIALGTNWIKGYRKDEYLQYDALNPLISNMGNHPQLIVGDDKSLLAEIRKKMDEKGFENARVIVLADEEVVTKELTELDNGKNVLLGVDNKYLTVDSYVRIMEMLEIAAKLAIDPDTPPYSINIPIEKRGNFWIFVPRAEPMNYERLKAIYEVQKFA